MKTIIGMFEDYDEAEDLLDDLVDEGFDRASIDIIKTEEGREKEKGGGFLQSLKKLFTTQKDIPESYRGYYSEGVRRGGVLVSIAVSDEDAERATELMNKHDAIDVEQRAESWKKAGWTGFKEGMPAYTSEEIAKERKVLPVTEEKVKVGKRQVAKGGVRVYSRVIATPVEEEISLREEHAKIERRTVDRPAAAGEAFEEESIEITETAEEPVVSKEARVKEEVVVGQEATEKKEKIRETARRTEVKVEGGEDFRTHFDSNYASLGGTYELYDPAYRFGGTIANDKRYMNKDWPTIENDIRADWEKEYPGTWDKFKGAIRYGWDKSIGRLRKAA